MNDGKDDDDMDAVLNKNSDDTGKRKSKSASHKVLITHHLRKVYGEVAGEGVPKRFIDLLNQLDGPEEQKS